MSIKIGGKTVATATPADLDAALIAATGCSAAETLEQLRQGGHASHVARALHPFLADAMPLADLSAMIAAGDVADVRGQVLGLYTAEPAPKAGKAPKAGA